MKRKLLLSAMCLLVSLPVFCDMKEDMFKYLQGKKEKESVLQQKDNREEAAGKKTDKSPTGKPSPSATDSLIITSAFADSDFASPEDKRLYYFYIFGNTYSNVHAALIHAKPGTSARAYAAKRLEKIPPTYDSSGKKKKSFGEVGSTVHVGYTSYCVSKSWWDTKTSDNPYSNRKPDECFLFIELTVRNNDKKSRTMPNLVLVDEKDNEYEQSSARWSLKGALGPLETLHPEVQKTGIILFDVPRNRDYRLKVSGGYWSGKNAIIEIK